MSNSVIQASSVCATVLAGGRATRMGGVDKGLQLFRGQTLVNIALQRLRQQIGTAPSLVAINANRNLHLYQRLGVPVWSDTVPDYAGPLAGFLTALLQCRERFEFVLCVPCDSPLFPLDLLQRLAIGVGTDKADIAMALGPELQPDGSTVLRPQPVFCLMRTNLATSLQSFIENGGRKIGAWTASLHQTKVAFDTAFDDPRAFANANTLDELHDLEEK